ncbi:uncharacterized protein LOC119089510 [Pollicipes pollicipes]|uniref:uncharacterized protein LOC119089510 n=1 Tax=Pollicipes pollicipes TaxID=41117 RepID=UPI0018850C03|nr:uncharacterized protein LOC119089510 [Pollicipes pollicipes]
MDRVKNLNKRMDMEDSPAKRSLLLSDPLRLNQPGSPRQRLPGLWGVHGQVRSLFDKPMTFPRGSLFDQPPFARHSSFGSQPAAESSDSGSQHEDDAPAAATTKTKPWSRRRPHRKHAWPP